ncbi:ATPase domain-containing protein [Fodinibius sp. Rm-B-1B1-1]|uniref:ATPase domain-containing protein n=1 Tax=Fodinibius alkaliphilus TaxID=3140241 RepID=UPI00315A9520
MNSLQKKSFGLSGLDEILYGGLIPQKSYLIQGGPGSGKSTMGLHFLSQVSKNNASGLYITLGESEKSIKENASQLDIDLSGVSFLDLSPKENLNEDSNSYSVFSAAEVEQQPMMDAIIEAVEKYEPNRVVLDSITMLRMLNKDPFKMRKLALSFIKFITEREATLLMISESMDDSSEQDATFWVDGIIKLESDTTWRRLKVTKLRGSDYQSGDHAFKITGQGVTVFPRLRANNYDRKFQPESLSTGIDELDVMLHGGIEKGTVSLLVGATGVGKTNLGLQLLKESASRNERAALYTFEESKELILERSKNVNIPIEDMIESGNLNIMPIEPLSYSPDEFTKMVRTDVEENGTQIVMIDSIGGYRLAVQEEDILERLHELTVYLQNMGVTSLLINEAQTVTGEFKATNMNASYLADNILFLRYLEINGQLRKSIGVLKKRLSDFEKFIREFKITSEGIKIGQPLENMRGILSGNPELLD